MKKKYKYSVVIGKFCPIHIGHEKLINKALNISSKTLIFVTNSITDKINIYKRISLIEKIYKNDIISGKLNIVEFKNPTIFNLSYGDLIFDKYYELTQNYPQVIIYGDDKDISFCFKEELINRLDTIVVKRDNISSTKIINLLKENNNIKIKDLINEKIIKDINKKILK